MPNPSAPNEKLASLKWKKAVTPSPSLKKQHIKVEWAGRAEQMRKALDGVYAQLRAALRE